MLKLEDLSCGASLPCFFTGSVCIRRKQENEYLEFVAGVTRDILARGVLSDLAMALLFQSHIERNRHRLRVVS